MQNPFDIVPDQTPEKRFSGGEKLKTHKKSHVYIVAELVKFFSTPIGFRVFLVVAGVQSVLCLLGTYELYILIVNLFK